MVAMCERSRLRLEPDGVVRVRRRDERQRAAERVDDFLEMAMLLPQPLGTPVPRRRKDPLREVLGKGKRNALEVTRRTERAVGAGARARWRGGRTGHDVKLAVG